MIHGPRRGANSAPSQRPLADTRAPDEGDGVDTSPNVSDSIAKTTCYMCACRCGIDVHHHRMASVRYINGNQATIRSIKRRNLRQGIGSGIMQQYSPAKLQQAVAAAPGRAVQRRVRARSSGKRLWRSATALARRHPPSPIRASSPSSPAATRAQALTGWWARQFGTPNYAAHGGFCSVNMAAGGLYSIGGSFWEFGEPDWDNTKYFMLFGVAEDHDSNPIKIGLGKLKARGGQGGVDQSLPHRLQCDCRRLDRHPARHRRAVRASRSSTNC